MHRNFLGGVLIDRDSLHKLHLLGPGLDHLVRIESPTSHIVVGNPTVRIDDGVLFYLIHFGLDVVRIN